MSRNEPIDQIICLPSTPPGCDMIGGRDLIFQVLRGAVHEDRLECFTRHQPDPEHPPVPSPATMRKVIPFEPPTGVVADLCGMSIPLQGCGDVAEL